MKTKKTALILLQLLCCALLSAQHSLQSTLNMFRPGDIIVKQQVDYKDPGRAGENVLWDFSKLNAVNSEYTISYLAPKLSPEQTYIMGLDTLSVMEVDPENLIIGYEHFTAYYYQLKNNRLFLLGHANAVSQMRNEKPVLLFEYPFSYKERICDDYYSKTFSAGVKPMKSRGEVSSEADAQGMMILPSGDTLRHVMRIKTVRTIIEMPDTIVKNRRNKAKEYKATNTLIESYLWYAKGYRYPVFETICQFNKNDSTHVEFFSTAFFYPPQEHHYLESDTENQAVLDSSIIIDNSPIDPKQWIKDNFRYNFNPNPVSYTLNIEYHLEQPAEVSISLYHTVNGIVSKIPADMKQSGSYTETLDCSSLPIGTYVLSFQVEGETVSSVVLKK